MTNMHSSMNGDNLFGLVRDENIPPVKCEYCGKLLYYVHPVVAGRQSSIGFYEMCDCEGLKREKAKEEQRYVQELQQKIKLEQVERLFKQSNLGRRFKDRTFENFKPEFNLDAYRIALDYAQNFEEYSQQGLGLIFTGSFGVGKTHLAAAIANYLIVNKSIPVVFGTVSALLGELKKAYDSESVSADRIEKQFCTVDLLIIDDLGKEKPTEWLVEKLYYIINSRYEDYKPLVIRTNLTLDEIEQRLNVAGSLAGSAIVSRLVEMCRIVPMHGQDFRLSLRKNAC